MTRFGRLEVIGAAPSGKQGRQLRCRCDCGVEKVLTVSQLNAGRIRSCGCARREKLLAARTTHGMTGTPTFRSWVNAIQRVTNPKNPRWAAYGGRGIKMCERWLGSFENFLADMGERPEGMTLDRWPDNDGDYEPTNCRWATWSEQRRNQRPRTKGTN